MDFSGYYDLATKTFASSLTQGGSSALPPLVAGEDITIRTRFRVTRNGVVEEINPEVVSMKAMLGVVDVRPLTGAIKLSVDGVPFTNAIAYDPNATGSDSFEEKLKEALDTLLGGSDKVEVQKRFNSYIVVFVDDPHVEREIEVVYNTLFPSAFLHIRKYMRSGRWEYDLRAVRSPVGFTNTFELALGPVPEVTRLRTGGEIDGTPWREIQGLFIPPSFTGTFRIKRNNQYSEPLSRESSLEDIASALEPLKDPGGEWEVTLPVSNTVYIYFGGAMAGQTFPLIEAEILQAPPSEHVVTFSTKTREMAEVMMELDSVALQLEVHAVIKDLEDPTIEQNHVILRRAVGVLESLDWDELATAPGIDWLNPPTLVETVPFAPGQVSNGMIHYRRPFGDGASPTFQIVHGLDTENVDVSVMENKFPGKSMVEGTHYTWERDNENQITITWLGSTPEEDEYLVTVVGLELTSFFDPHGHFIHEIDGLADWISSAEQRFSMLLGSTGLGARREVVGAGSAVSRWQLPDIFELYPSRVQPTRPEGGRLSSVDLNETTEDGVKIINRGKGLLPAVHNAVVSALPSPLPSPSQAYVGAVFQNQTGGIVTLGGGYGLRTYSLPPLGYAACDGALWYPVTPHGRWVSQPVATDYADNNKLFAYTDEKAEQLASGAAIELSTTGVLPTGLSSGTTYYIVNPDFTDRTFSLALTQGGEPVEISSDGTGVLSILIPTNITYYPVHFERTLATVSVNENQLRPGKDFFLGFGFEAVLLKNSVDAQLAVMVEIGEARKVDTVGLENDNLEEIVWRRIPALEQMVVLSNLSTTHRFGLHVSRRNIGGKDVISANRMLYGTEEINITPPRTANFLVRIRIGKFDTSDQTVDKRGLLMFSGLTVDDGGAGAIGNYQIGQAVII